nr:RecName: Full=Unknown protein from spot 118 of 2D-PAGE of thylakoid [Pisum sativum]
EEQEQEQEQDTKMA